MALTPDGSNSHLPALDLSTRPSSTTFSGSLGLGETGGSTGGFAICVSPADEVCEVTGAAGGVELGWFWVVTVGPQDMAAPMVIKAMRNNKPRTWFFCIGSSR